MPRVPRALAADLLLVVLLVALGLWFWPHGELPGVSGLTLPEGSPAWSTPQDHLYDGLDAGEWADQARTYVNGRYGALDGHRMPTWTILTGLVSTLGLVGRLDLALAGHLVNHLLQLALGPIVYCLGRAWGMGRGTSLLAGAVVASSSVLVLASRRFGVDPTVTTLVPLCLLTAHVVRWRWWLAPVAGVVSAFAAASHFTTLPFVVPAAFSVVAVARPGERFAASVAFIGGFAAAWFGMFHTFPWIGVHKLMESVGESASHEAAGVPGMPGWERMLRAGIEAARTDLARSSMDYCARLHTWAPPAAATIALAVLGVAGVGLDTRAARTPGWVGGVILAMALAPVPVLLTMHAASRYTDNLLPILTLLAVRGLAVLVAVAAAAGAERWGRAREGAPDEAAGLAAGALACSAMAVGIPTANLSDALVDRDVGALLREHSPAGGCVVSALRDAIAYTDQRFVRVDCPVSATESSYRSCLTGLRSQCEGRDAVTWLVFQRTPLDERTAARRGMDEWAIKEFGAVGEYKAGAIHVWAVVAPFEREPSRR